MIGFNLIKKFPTLFTLLMLELILLLVIAYQLQVSRKVDVLEKTTLTVLGPVQELTNALVGSVSDVLRNKKTRDELDQENQKMRASLEGLEQLRTQLEEAELENARLRVLLSLPSPTGWKAIPAQVVGRASRNSDFMITLNKGSRAGIREDMGVICERGVVGVVWEVSGSYSKILTANNPAAVIAAMVQDSRYQESYVSGIDLLTGRLDNFPNFETLHVGDLVLTSGLDDVFPKGIHLGRVTEARSSSYLFQDVRVGFSADFSRLEEVMVLVRDCSEETP